DTVIATQDRRTPSKREATSATKTTNGNDRPISSTTRTVSLTAHVCSRKRPWDPRRGPTVHEVGSRDRDADQRAQRRPSFLEQLGHAPQPEDARTRSATTICCSRVAWCAA